MYYKFLTRENTGRYSKFDFTPYLPTGSQPGPWLPKVTGKLKECKRGYHACRPKDILEWLDAQMWEVEYKNPPLEYDDKVNGKQVRFVRRIETWNERTVRLFAVWCARELLSLVQNPDPDPRSVEACNVAERYANGNASRDELIEARCAARDAARAGARDAAWAGARDAARSSRDNEDEDWSVGMDKQTRQLWDMLGYIPIPEEVQHEKD